MNKSEFINELKVCLRYMPKEDRDDAIAYYTEYIGDMEIADTEDVVSKLGTPKQVAQEILDNYTVKVVEAQKESGSVKDSGKVVWLVILGILSLPIALPLALVVLCVVLAIALAIFSVLLAFLLAGIWLVIAGIVGLILSFFNASIGNIIMSLGLSLAIIGLGLLFTIGTIELTKLVIKGFGALAVKSRQKASK